MHQKCCGMYFGLRWKPFIMLEGTSEFILFMCTCKYPSRACILCGLCNKAYMSNVTPVYDWYWIIYPQAFFFVGVECILKWSSRERTRQKPPRRWINHFIIYRYLSSISPVSVFNRIILSLIHITLNINRRQPLTKLTPLQFVIAVGISSSEVSFDREKKINQAIAPIQWTMKLFSMCICMRALWALNDICIMFMQRLPTIAIECVPPSLTMT